MTGDPIAPDLEDLLYWAGAAQHGASGNPVLRSDLPPASSRQARRALERQHRKAQGRKPDLRQWRDLWSAVLP